MNSPKNSDKKLLKKFGKKKPKYVKNIHKKVEKIVDENKIENDTYFVNCILKCYHKYYVKYFRFIRQIQFQIDVNSLISNDYQKINCIYHGKTKQIEFLYIGHVLSKKLYWVNNFQKVFYEIYFSQNKIFDKYNLSNKFLKEFFDDDYIELNHHLILHFIFYLINMMNKNLKVIDVKDPITKISVIGLIQINYFDDFDLYKHFLNVY